MRYLQMPEMRRLGLDRFGAWAKTYGQKTYNMEQTPAGNCKVTQRFADFVNLPGAEPAFPKPSRHQGSFRSAQNGGGPP